MALPAGAHIRKGTGAAYFLPAVAGGSPTRAEITAGLRLGARLTSLDGWNTDRSNVPVPVLDTLDTEQIPGERTLGDGSITFVDITDTVDTYRTTLAESTTGFVILMPHGDVEGKKLEKWPVKVKDVNDNWDLGNTFASFTVGFAKTGSPLKTGTVPAAA